MHDAHGTEGQRLSIMITENEYIIQCGSGARHTCRPIHRSSYHQESSTMTKRLHSRFRGPTTEGNRLLQQYWLSVHACISRVSNNALPVQSNMIKVVGRHGGTTQ